MDQILEYRRIIEEKVKGKIVSQHNEFGHFYKLPSGKIVSSVTTKLIVEKPHLSKWAAKLAFEFMEGENRWQRLHDNPALREDLLQGAILAHTENRDNAGVIGNQVHDIIEDYINKWIADGKPIDDIRTLIPANAPYQVWGAVRSAEAAFKKYKIIPIASELLVGSDKFSGAGTLDFLVANMEFDGFPVLELWDFKSSNSAKHDTYAMQIAAYKKFFEEMSGLKIEKCRIIHLDKGSDRFKIYNIPNISSAFKAYKSIASVHDWINNGKKKLLEDTLVIKI